jgi:hypothetical protein
MSDHETGVAPKSTPWWIEEGRPDDGGPSFYVVATETGSDSIRFTVNAATKAIELRDTLNRINPAATTAAL